MTTQKLATACRYAATPNTYAFLWRKSVGRFLGAPRCLEASAPQARAWCHRLVVTNKEALRLATGATSSAPLERRFPKDFAEASAAVAACPQRMGGGANLELLHDLVALSGASQVLETGVAYGWSSLAILLALQARESARLVSTNLHYREFESDGHVGCAVAGRLHSMWTIIHKADSEALPEALDHFPRGIDLCHYDSDKSYEGRLRSYAILWRALRLGGLFISDDIQDNLAFAHFCRMASAVPVVTDAESTDGVGKFIGIARKLHDRPLRRMRF